MYVYVPRMCLVPTEATRRQALWNCSYRWGLGVEPTSLKINKCSYRLSHLSSLRCPFLSRQKPASLQLGNGKLETV